MLHSHLSDAERHWQWQQIADGQVQVVVGARSAIFAPTPQPGADRAGRGARDDVQAGDGPALPRPRRGRCCGARRKRCRWCWARPRRRWRAGTGRSRASIDWWRCPAACSAGRCRRVGTIDLRDEANTQLLPRARSAASCTRPCTRRCDEGGQVILLLNRRGFSTHIQCPACGLALECPALRHRPDAPPHRGDRPVPLLRLPGAGARPSAPSATSAASATAAWARSGWRPRSGPGFPTSRACGWTPTRCAAAQATSGPWTPSARARCGSCWARR